MIKLILKFAIYTLILIFFWQVGVIKDAGFGILVALAAVLSGFNTVLRPITNIIALPFNMFTFGIASVFSNLLCLVIANATIGKVIHGFWIMLLIAFVVMLADDLVRLMRLKLQKESLQQTV